MDFTTSHRPEEPSAAHLNGASTTERRSSVRTLNENVELRSDICDQLQQNLGQLPETDQLIVRQTWAAFAAASPRLRCFMLGGLLAHCDLSQLSFLAQSLSYLIRIDFLTALPRELAFKILSYLDAQSLCYTAQVSKLWRCLSDDDIIWQRMCEQHTDKRCAICGWGLPPLGGRPTPWKFIFASRLIVERNWRKGRFRVRVLSGHTDGIMCLQMDNEFLITGSYDQTVRVWNVQTGRLLRILTGHSKGVRTLQFDKKILITGSMDNTLRVWDYHTGQCIRRLSGHTSSVVSLHFDDNRRLASGSADHTIRVWDFNAGTCFTLTGHCDWVNSVKIYKNQLFSGSDDTTIRIWDLETRTCVRTLVGHVQSVQCIQLAPALAFSNKFSRSPVQHMLSVGNQSNDGPEADASPVLVSGSLDNSIKVWDIQTGACLRTQSEHMEGVWSLAVDKLRIVSGAHDKTVKIWDKDTGECLHTLTGHEGPVTCVALGDTKIVTGSDDGKIRLWDCCRN
ncbi:3023_t:CDS:2 [Paraglomus brasilianum]|uniref:3023_t:CDS:1 n=1 Tax=Paraglomus brasilianum TaxID=144538 RepID=A0A9N9BEU5_9GLOM|nr:3023_t:CDS:2 [Paraglomus brasilianum]